MQKAATDQNYIHQCKMSPHLKFLRNCTNDVCNTQVRVLLWVLQRYYLEFSYVYLDVCSQSANEQEGTGLGMHHRHGQAKQQERFELLSVKPDVVYVKATCLLKPAIDRTNDKSVPVTKQPAVANEMATTHLSWAITQASYTATHWITVRHTSVYNQ